MVRDAITTAIAYYTAMGEKNVESMATYLHPDVDFSSPVAKLKGKEGVLEGAKRLIASFTKLTIRTKMTAGDQAMLVIDLEFPGLAETFGSVALLTVREGYIAKIELFFDTGALKK